MKGDGVIAPGIEARGGLAYVQGSDVQVARVLRELASVLSREEAAERLGIDKSGVLASLRYACEIGRDHFEVERTWSYRNEGTHEVAPGIRRP